MLTYKDLASQIIYIKKYLKETKNGNNLKTEIIMLIII